jgi:predicted CXXCH cytochrome family protein
VLALIPAAASLSESGGKEGNRETPASQPAAAAPLPSSDAATHQHLVSGLIGSKHDFRGINAEVRDVCLPCHTPHKVSGPPPQFDRRSPTLQPLNPYIAPTVDVHLSGWSLLCLGCHDGVTAQDIYSSAHAVNVVEQLANSRLGARGVRGHPVGTRYPRASQEKYATQAAVEAAGLPLPDGRIQCATCHDAHNTDNHAGMLRVSNDGSRLCLICHRL